jgi:hypothetical protein
MQPDIIYGQSLWGEGQSKSGLSDLDLTVISFNI